MTQVLVSLKRNLLIIIMISILLLLSLILWLLVLLVQRQIFMLNSQVLTETLLQIKQSTYLLKTN